MVERRYEALKRRRQMFLDHDVDSPLPKYHPGLHVLLESIKHRERAMNEKERAAWEHIKLEYVKLAKECENLRKQVLYLQEELVRRT
jgi:hypothetical protein